MKSWIIIIICCLGTLTTTAQSGSLAGTVKDVEALEAIIFGNVFVYQNDSLVVETATDFDGNYQLPSLAPGHYQIKFTYVAYHDLLVTEVLVLAGEESRLEALLRPLEVEVSPVRIIRMKKHFCELVDPANLPDIPTDLRTFSANRDFNKKHGID